MKSGILLAIAIVISATQTSNQSFAGTWTAEHAGQTFVRLELEGAGATLGGRISLGDIELDKTGQVKTAKAAPRNATPIFDVAESAGRLTFAHKDGRDTDRFELKRIDATSAELTFVLTEAMRKDLVSQGI
ncbi:MAG TPA: hypothetical protein VFV78_07835, partial [Vicinamibacterales bacterium]|nr:hypothetical protein [Vicinamibacterales bacterium]